MLGKLVISPLMNHEREIRDFLIKPLIQHRSHDWLWPMHMCVLNCFTLFDPMEYSPPGYSVHGILPARILKCVAVSYPRESSQPRD